jgi:hypothetical protein
MRKWDLQLQSVEPIPLIGILMPESLRSAVFILHSILLVVLAKITETTRAESYEDPIYVPEALLFSTQMAADPPFQGGRTPTQSRTSVEVQASFKENGQLPANFDLTRLGGAND